jgi:hypothetical protein
MLIYFLRNKLEDKFLSALYNSYSSAVYEWIKKYEVNSDALRVFFSCSAKRVNTANSVWRAIENILRKICLIADESDRKLRGISIQISSYGVPYGSFDQFTFEKKIIEIVCKKYNLSFGDITHNYYVCRSDTKITIRDIFLYEILNEMAIIEVNCLAGSGYYEKDLDILDFIPKKYKKIHEKIKANHTYIISNIKQFI